MTHQQPGSRPANSPRRRGSLFALAASIAAATLSAACGGGGGAPDVGPVYTPPPPPAPVEDRDRLYYGDRGGIPDSVRIVVRDAERFGEEWARATSRQSNPPAPPTVDFSNRMVVIVGAGRMTTEDRIRVDRVGIRPEVDAEGRTRDMLIVVVRTIRGCGRSTLDAFPLEIVSVPRHDVVRFEDSLERDPNCGDAAPTP